MPRQPGGDSDSEAGLIVLLIRLGHAMTAPAKCPVPDWPFPSHANSGECSPATACCTSGLRTGRIPKRLLRTMRVGKIHDVSGIKIGEGRGGIRHTHNVPSRARTAVRRHRENAILRGVILSFLQRPKVPGRICLSTHGVQV